MGRRKAKSENGDGDSVLSLNGLVGNINLVEGSSVDISVDGNDITISADFQQTGKYLISGGVVWSGTDLDYNVSIISYFFNGLHSTPITTQVTLNPGDSTYDRIDAVVVDESGVVTVVEGIPSENPATPAIEEDQLLVQYIFVGAGTTEPDLDVENIYLDVPTANWTNTIFSGGGASGTIVFNDTNNPKQGTMEITANTNSARSIYFVRDTSISLADFSIISLWVRFPNPVASNRSLTMRFTDSNDSVVGGNISVFNHGAQRSVINEWQLVVIPVSVFGSISVPVKGLRMIMGGGSPLDVIGWDVDWVYLTSGSVPATNTPTINFYAEGLLIGNEEGLDLVAGNGITITPTVNPLNSSVEYLIESNAGGGTVTQINTAKSITGGPITGTGTIELVGDEESPANNRYYGTDSAGNRGFFSATNLNPYILYDENPTVTSSGNTVSIDSIAIGVNNTASGEDSIALGKQNNVTGKGAIAIGQPGPAGIGAIAEGNFSMALSSGAYSVGESSVAIMGTSNGGRSVALGFGATAQSFGEVTVGGYPTSYLGSTTDWVETDRIFNVGVGPQARFAKDAFTILKNGNVGIGDSNPAFKLSIGGVGAMLPPLGTTAERPSTVVPGLVRFNTTLDVYEYVDNGDNWKSFGDVFGPSSSTTRNIPIFGGVTGKVLDDSGVGIDVSQNIYGLNNVEATSLSLGTANTGAVINTNTSDIPLQENTAPNPGGFSSNIKSTKYTRIINSNAETNPIYASNPILIPPNSSVSVKYSCTVMKEGVDSVNYFEGVWIGATNSSGEVSSWGENEITVFNANIGTDMFMGITDFNTNYITPRVGDNSGDDFIYYITFTVDIITD